MDSHIKEKYGINILIGRNIRRIRKMNNKTLLDIAESISPKVSPQQWRKYEVGVNRTPADMLYAFAKMMRVPMEMFFTKERLWPIRPKKEDVCSIVKLIAQGYLDGLNKGDALNSGDTLAVDRIAHE